MEVRKKGGTAIKGSEGSKEREEGIKKEERCG